MGGRDDVSFALVVQSSQATEESLACQVGSFADAVQPFQGPEESATGTLESVAGVLVMSVEAAVIELPEDQELAVV